MDTQGIALALGAAGFFGLGLVLTQIGLREVSPLRGASISVPTSAGIFALLSPLLIDVAGIHAGSVLLFALAGCLFPATVTLLTFEANRRIGPHLTGALGNLTPLFAVLIAFIVLGEVPRSGQLLGIAVIIGGVLLLVRRPPGTPGRLAAWAIALPICAAFIRGLVQPVVKLGLETWPSPFAAALIGYLVSTLVVLGAGTLEKESTTPRLQGRGWLWFCAIGTCNGLAVLSMYAALARGPVSLVAPLAACYPLATLLFSRLLLGSTGLGRRTLAGVATTVLGVALLLQA